MYNTFAYVSLERSVRILSVPVRLNSIRLGSVPIPFLPSDEERCDPGGANIRDVGRYDV